MYNPIYLPMGGCRIFKEMLYDAEDLSDASY